MCVCLCVCMCTHSRHGFIHNSLNLFCIPAYEHALKDTYSVFIHNFPLAPSRERARARSHSLSHSPRPYGSQGRSEEEARPSSRRFRSPPAPSLGGLRIPCAKKPFAHGTHGSCRPCARSTPCPGTHMQFATLVDIVVEVFLLVGHAVHGMLLRSAEKKP